jgi:ATP-binding protein involved in chromosome partitioning
MTKISEKTVRSALKTVKLPDGSKDIVASGLLSSVLTIDEKDGCKVILTLEADPKQAEKFESLRLEAEKAVALLEGVSSVKAVLAAHRQAPEAPIKLAAVGTTKPSLQGVKNVIVVASGKGGVGKSTTSVNLAVALAAEGQKVGLLDADFFGPSVARMMNISGKPEVNDDNKMVPPVRYGVAALSMGAMVAEDAPVIWRGPMLHGALRQMLHEVAWGDLDILVVDLPPGTGDTHISISQLVSVSGAVIVSTPQDIALLDARRCIGMFGRVEVPILGVIENMSYFVCPHCGGRSDIFNHGGAEHEAERIKVPFLGAIPLDLIVRETSDSGKPVVATLPEGAQAKNYREIARKLIESLGSKVGA